MINQKKPLLIYSKKGKIMYRDINIYEYINNERAENDVLVDLRDANSFRCGSLPKAVNIPLDNIAELYSLPQDKRICVFCQYGEFSPQAAELLDDAGYEVIHLTGGYKEYLLNKFKEN